MSSSRQSGAAALARIAAFAALVSLSACGGGGGSSSPSPTLTASAAATSATAGGQPVALMAVATNSTDTVTWSLTGPGSLSATSGATVNYIPPAPDALGASAQATVTATLGTLTKTVVLDLATAPGGTWEMTQAPSADIAAVVQANGGYLAVGARGEVQTSTDGTSWTPAYSGDRADFTGVALGSAGYVAVGTGGNIASSPDGKTWTVEPSIAPAGNAFKLVGIAYDHGLYVAAGNNGVYTSADGATWTAVPLFAATFGAGGIVSGNGRFVAATYAGTAVSDDGVNWTLAPSAPAGMTNIAFGNGHFVAACSTGITTSSDGVTWTTPVVVGSTEVTSISFAGGHFFVETPTLLSISSDGSTWTTGNNPSILDAYQTPTVFTTTPSGAYVMLGVYGLVATSSDLATWTQVGPADRGDGWNSVAWANGIFETVDADGHTWSSADGRSWTAGTLADPAIDLVVAANGQFFAGGQAGSLQTSPDGVTWATRTTGIPDRIMGVAWGNGLYVAVGDTGGIVTSPDGATWTVASTSTTPDYEYVTVAYGAGLFVATDNFAHVATSPDGVHWTMGTTDFGIYVNSIAYGPAGFVAATPSGLWHSVDGLAWTQDSLPSTARRPLGVTYGGGRYVAVGGSALTLTSTDGVTWTQAASAPQFNWALASVAFDGHRFVAVGERGEVLVSTH